MVPAWATSPSWSIWFCRSSCWCGSACDDGIRQIRLPELPLHPHTRPVPLLHHLCDHTQHWWHILLLLFPSFFSFCALCKQAAQLVTCKPEPQFVYCTGSKAWFSVPTWQAAFNVLRHSEASWCAAACKHWGNGDTKPVSDVTTAAAADTRLPIDQILPDWSYLYTTCCLSSPLITSSGQQCQGAARHCL